MNKYSIFVGILLLSSLNAFSQSIEGVYVGLHELCFLDSLGNKDCEFDKSNPGFNWYHLTAYKLINDSVYIDKMPIAIKGTDTLFSASDGGFYYRRGLYEVMDSTILIKTLQYSCDYCPIRMMNDSTQIINNPQEITATRKGRDLMIDGYLFRKLDISKTLISETNGLNQYDIIFDRKD